MSVSQVHQIENIKVSSVLNRNGKEYGKQKMFDGAVETCWNSHQGTPQWIELKFKQGVHLSSLSITFQGGFVGKDCELYVKTREKPDTFTYLANFYPDDINSPQTFPCKCDSCLELRILFPESTDFYGRVTIYNLDLFS